MKVTQDLTACAAPVSVDIFSIKKYLKSHQKSHNKIAFKNMFVYFYAVNMD